MCFKFNNGFIPFKIFCSVSIKNTQVLPAPPQLACLRSTDNGAILHSGGTISGRRPLSLMHPHDASKVSNTVYEINHVVHYEPDQILLPL